MFFVFPADARWNPDLYVVEFSVGIGDYSGLVPIPRQVFRHLLGHAETAAVP